MKEFPQHINSRHDLECLVYDPDLREQALNYVQLLLGERFNFVGGVWQEDQNAALFRLGISVNESVQWGCIDHGCPPAPRENLEEAKAARCLDVERERDRRIYGGFPVVFPDGQARIQSRGEQDWTNIAGIGIAGLEAIVSGVPPDTEGTGLGFKDEANIWHAMTPAQAVDFGRQAKGYRAAVYTASWEHKQAIKELPNPEAVAAYDITTMYWPEA